MGFFVAWLFVVAAYAVAFFWLHREYDRAVLIEDEEGGKE